MPRRVAAAAVSPIRDLVLCYCCYAPDAPALRPQFPFMVSCIGHHFDAPNTSLLPSTFRHDHLCSGQRLRAPLTCQGYPQHFKLIFCGPAAAAPHSSALRRRCQFLFQSSPESAFSDAPRRCFTCWVLLSCHVGIHRRTSVSIPKFTHPISIRVLGVPRPG